MTKKIPLYAVILIVICAVLITFQITYVSVWKSFRQSELDIDLDGGIGAIQEKLKLIYDIYGENYIGQLDPKQLENGAMMGLVYGTGDRYGEYMDPETYAEFTSDAAGDTEGIGIMVIKNSDSELIEIVDIVPNSPASESELHTGDLICKVGNEDVMEVGYNKALDLMLGKAGTVAEFTVYRNGEYIDFAIERRHVEQVNVSSRLYSDGITGIIRITAFDEVTATQFKNAIAELQNQGAERFVFDMRNNSGGLLDSVVEILDYLLPEGTIIRITGNDGLEETIASDAEELDVPMAVLVNGATASAAELFTAALRDYEKSVTVGTTTYGKGSMQTVIPFTDGSALRITFKMYSPPKSENYDGVGITPDIEIELDDALSGKSIYTITDAEDNQLQAAIAALSK